MVVGKLAMLVYTPLISVSKCLNNEKKNPVTRVMVTKFRK